MIKEEIIYSRDEAIKESKKYFNGDDLSSTVFVNKYALKDSKGNLFETNPDMMHSRLANELARIEANYPNPLSYNDIYDLIKNFKYIIPQGSPMAGIGNNKQIVSISNCFVVGNPVGQQDSYGAIFKIDEKIAQLQKRRCGVGTDISGIRPAGVGVNNAAITSTGMIPFAERYSNTTREVAQDGRRGALMISASIRHPEAELFIDAKLDSSKITGANISVKIHDDFMEAMLDGRMYNQQWPITGTPIVKKVTSAPLLWKKIIHNAWKSAEPGVLFWDKIIEESPADIYKDYGFETVSTNPCGELPLCSGDSCRLLALNLYSYVINPFTANAYFDFELFKKHAVIAQRLMDDIVDLELEKIDLILNKIKSDPENNSIKQVELDMWEEIKYKCETGRRTGTGVTAEGDMLAALGLTYGTKEATKFAESVHKCLAIEAYKSSCIMAKERGAFPIYNYDLELNHPFITRLINEDAELKDLMFKYGRRNIALLTIAPTGTVSLMTQTTSGIEPAFQVYYGRNRKINPNDKDVNISFVDQNGDAWESYVVFHHHFKTWMTVNGYDVDNVSKLSPEEINELVKKSPYYNAMANEVDWVEKVTMQGAIQKWIDHSISVTVNLPNNVTEELVNDVYVTAWKSGCKGCTIYRDGCRTGVLVSLDKKEEISEAVFKENHAPKRPKYLDCDVLRFVNKGEKWIGFVGLLDGKPYEIFTGKAVDLLSSIELSNDIEKGKIRKTKHDDGTKTYDFIFEIDNKEIVIQGLNTSFDPNTYDMSKTFSAILRHGMPLPYVITMIDSLNLDGDLINTWKSGVKRMIKKYIPDGTVIKSPTKPINCPHKENKDIKCNLVYLEGCLTCATCGNSKC